MVLSMDFSKSLRIAQHTKETVHHKIKNKNLKEKEKNKRIIKLIKKRK